MRRKIYDELLRWKRFDQGETAIIIDGAHRVGKSYIAEEFGKNEYRSYILVDLNKVSNAVKSLFNDYMDDLDTFYSFLSAYYNTPLYPRESLIILDEVQDFPRARSCVKYLVADGRYDILETGSLLSIKENTKGILIPSEEHHVDMFPMDFEEFLWALGNDTLMSLCKACFDSGRPLGDAMHRKAIALFRQYLVIGGMPQAVASYVEHHDFFHVDRVKRDILALYRQDITKHAEKANMPLLGALFDSIPSMLSQHEKDFSPSLIRKGSKTRDYGNAIFWLSEAGIVNLCFNSTEPNIGLGMNEEKTKLKCYMGDTGLLMSLAFDERSLAEDEIYKKIIMDKLEFNSGMLVENIVAQMLRATGAKLYFYSNYDKISNQDTMEIDFLIRKRGVKSRHNICPIEVKSGKNYTLSSLNKFSFKYSQYVGTRYVVHTLDYKEKNGVIYLPLYMVPFL